MKTLGTVLFFSIVLAGNPAHASFTATGQSCELAPDPLQPDVLAICFVSTTSHNLNISLIGKLPNLVRHVRFSYTDTTRPLQTINLSASPLIDPETVAIMFVDFNFDGHQDFAIMTTIETGENVAYKFFLYNPKNKQFQTSSNMAAIVNPEVNSSQKHIRSYWRKNAKVSGWNFWQWHNNTPFIAKQVEQSINNKGECQQTTLHMTKQRKARSTPIACP